MNEKCSSCWSRGATRRTSDRRQKANEVIEMKCPHCGKEMKEGYLFTSKDVSIIEKAINN